MADDVTDTSEATLRADYAKTQLLSQVFAYFESAEAMGKSELISFIHYIKTKFDSL